MGEASAFDHLGNDQMVDDLARGFREWCTRNQSEIIREARVRGMTFEECICRLLDEVASRIYRNTILAGELEIDLAERVCFRNGRPVKLASKEFSVLAILAKRAGTVTPRQELLAIWGGKDGNIYITPKILSVYIAKLRSKLGEERITAVTGEGYRLEV